MHDEAKNQQIQRRQLKLVKDVIFIDKLEDGRDCRERRLIPTEQKEKVEAKENLKS